MSGKRYTVAVDFDGVIHRYDTPFIDPHTIPDQPVTGALEWLDKIGKRFDIAIFTTRARTVAGENAVEDWLWEKGVRTELLSAEVYDALVVTATKPPALVYIDDRAYRFDGANFPSPHEIHSLKPWHKTEAADPQTQPERSGGHNDPDPAAPTEDVERCSCEPPSSHPESAASPTPGDRDPDCPVHGKGTHTMSQRDTAVNPRGRFDPDTGQEWCTGCWGEGIVGPAPEDVCPRCEGTQYEPLCICEARPDTERASQEGPPEPDPACPVHGQPRAERRLTKKEQAQRRKWGEEPR